MSVINVLDRHTAELIAAGEVVERPASAVKELLENSIDALATAITVEIEGGGVRMLRITDNGTGIPHTEVPKAFLRHATSKISTESDLYAIGSLGFRGEALASIAAVADVELLTRAGDEDLGTKYVIRGGAEQVYEQAGCPAGTTITVRELFFNIPARMKFLKKDVAEANAVSAVIDRLALSHPEISFKFIREGKNTLLTPGDSKLRSAVYAVYGKEFASSLIPVEYTLNGIDISGMISKPAAARANRNMQHFYINDRFVRSGTMMAALEAAFKGSIQAGKFPACVLNLSIPFDGVDVNVHPAKTEVRFTNERPVFDCVFHAVKSALGKGDRSPEMRIPEEKPPGMPLAAAAATKGEQVRFQSSFSAGNTPNSCSFKAPDIFVDEPEIEKISSIPKLAEDLPLMASDYKYSLYETKQDRPVDVEKLVEPLKPEIEKTEPDQKFSLENTFLGSNNDALPETEVDIKYIGEAFDTYILLESPDSIIYIDKHAAHERIIYNRLKNNLKNDIQMLLAPVSVTLSKEEYGALTGNLELAESSGFEIEDFGGGTVLVRSVPAALSGEDIAGMIAEIAGEMILNSREAVPERLDGILHSVACRAALKGGNKSTREELISLSREIFADGGVRYCPHGRPVAFSLKKREIEKQFGRA